MEVMLFCYKFSSQKFLGMILQIYEKKWLQMCVQIYKIIRWKGHLVIRQSSLFFNLFQQIIVFVIYSILGHKIQMIDSKNLDGYWIMNSICSIIYIYNNINIFDNCIRLYLYRSLMKSSNIQDKLSLQNYRIIDSNGSKSMYYSNESDVNSQKKLIIDLRSQLSNLKTEFTKLITKPADNTSNHSENQETCNKISANLRKSTKNNPCKEPIVISQQYPIHSPAPIKIQSSLRSSNSNLISNQYSNISRVACQNDKKYNIHDDNMSETKSNTNSNSTDKSKLITYSNTIKHRFYTASDSKNSSNDQCRQSSKSSGSHAHVKQIKNPNFQKDKQPRQTKICHTINYRNKIEYCKNQVSKVKPEVYNDRDKRLCQSTYIMGAQNESTGEQSVLTLIKDEQYQMLKETISQLELEKSDLQNRISEIQHQLKLKNSENSLKNKKIQQLENLVNSFQKSRSHNDQRLDMHSSITQFAENQETEKQKILKNTRILQIRLRQENQRNTLLQKQIQRLGKQILAINSEKNNIQLNHKQLIKQRNLLGEELENTKKSENKKNQWVNSLSKKVRELEMNKSNLISDYEGMVNQLKNEIQELQKMGPLLTEKQVLIGKSKEMMRQKDEILSKILKQKKELIAEKQVLKKEITVLQKTDKILQLQNLNKSVKQKYESIICKKQQENKQLFKTVRYQKDQITKLNQKMNSLQSENQQLKSRVSKHTSPHKEIKKQKKCPQNDQKVIGNLLNDLSILEKEIGVCQKNNTINQNIIADLNEELIKARMANLNQKYARYYI